MRVAANAIQRRRLDVHIGAVVLAGIVVGAVLGLVSHDPRLVLLEGSVPTTVFGLACLAGCAHQSPPAQQGGGVRRARTARGDARWRGLWHCAGYQRAYRVVTAVWRRPATWSKARRASGHSGEHVDGHGAHRIQVPPVCQRRHLGRIDSRVRALSMAQGLSNAPEKAP